MASAVNINRVWADLLVEELVRAGVGLFCLSPGSRSTPLATAVAANPRADHVVHFDERGTAYCALGYGRATRRPAAWITTSGTAVANGLPAVVEASVDHVPLLMITADRPPELRETGANQTIDQVKIFGNFVRWAFDVPAPDTAVDPAFVLTTADQAVYRARRSPSGPVHLNAMFREPLAPDPDGGEYAEYLRPLTGWSESDRPYTRYAGLPAPPDPAHMSELGARLRRARAGLVIAGRLDTPAQADAVRWLADRLGWPILPDACSQLRLGGPARPDRLVTHYDLMLGSASFRERCAPDTVLYVGARSTSKRLNRYLAEARPEAFVVVRDAPDRTDPHHRVTDHIEADVLSFCDRLAETMGAEPPGDTAWSDAWMQADETARRVLDEELAGELSEPMAARRVVSSAREGSGLVLASSMPVRDVDAYAASDGPGPFTAANRGASGIDGTLATAVGLARGLDREVSVLIGDLALLHDLNSLALVADSPRPVLVVVINNHGGGIFSFLPIARHGDVFEPYFGTPHGWSFARAAEMFGLDYRLVESAADLDQVCTDFATKRRSCVAEIETDRESNVKLHRRIERAIAEAIS